MKFEKEHTLPMLAVHATWVAVQNGHIKAKGKPLSIEKLLGDAFSGDGDKAQARGPMTRSAMMSEALMLKEFHDKQMEKEKEEGVS